MEIVKHRKTALLFGLDNKVGQYCLDFLIQSNAYHRIIVFTVKAPDEALDSVEFIEIDFDQIDSFADSIKGNDLFYCTNSFLQKGTYVVDQSTASLSKALPIAKIAIENKVNQFILLSTQAADVESIWEINRLRGTLEKQIAMLSYWAVHIFKPSIIIDEAPQNRWGESIAEALGEGLDYFLGGFISDYRPIEAEVVAKAMVRAAQKLSSGVHVCANKTLQKLAKEFDEEN